MPKKSEMGGGGVIQFSNYTPPNPTSPPYPIKNERSLTRRHRRLLYELKSVLEDRTSGMTISFWVVIRFWETAHLPLPKPTLTITSRLG